MLHFHDGEGQAAEQRLKRVAYAHIPRAVAQGHAAVLADLRNLCAGQIADGKRLGRIIGRGGCRRGGHGDIRRKGIEYHNAGCKA